MYECAPLEEIDLSAIPTVSKFRGIGAGMVYGLSTTRNAWHGRKSHRRRQNWMFVRFSDATQHAEATRIQGSRFHIWEIPALAFRHDRGVIYVVEPRSDRPLQQMLHSIPDRVDLEVLVDWALAALGDEGVVCSSPLLEVAGLVLPTRNMTSRSRGPDLKLNWPSWMANENQVDVGPIHMLRDVLALRHRA